MGYTIGFVANGGIVASGSIATLYDQAQIPDPLAVMRKSSSGSYSYIFDGWYYDAELADQVIAGEEITQNVTLYAKYIEVYGWSITYYKGATVVGYEQVAVALPNPLPYYPVLGYTFYEWYKEPGLLTQATPGTEMTDAVALFGSYVPTTYTITYNLNGGTNNLSNPASYDITSSTIVLQTATKTNYTFGGWYLESNFVTQITQINSGSTGNVTLYAKWTANLYDITYNSNGGSAVSPTTGVTAFTSTLPTSTKSNYTFAGWWNSALEIQYLAGQTIQGNIIVYAKWIVNSYTDPWVENGGTPAPYEKTNWVNNQTPLNEVNLNKLEQGVKDAHDNIGQHQLEIDTIKDTVNNDHSLRISTNETHIEQGDLREAALKDRVDIIQPQHEEILAGTKVLPAVTLANGVKIEYDAVLGVIQFSYFEGAQIRKQYAEINKMYDLTLTNPAALDILISKANGTWENQSKATFLEQVAKLNVANILLEAQTFKKLTTHELGANMNNYKVTGVANGTTSGDAINYDQYINSLDLDGELV